MRVHIVHDADKQLTWANRKRKEKEREEKERARKREPASIKGCDEIVNSARS